MKIIIFKKNYYFFYIIYTYKLEVVQKYMDYTKNELYEQLYKVVDRTFVHDLKDFLKLLAKANIWTPQEVLEYIKQGRLSWQDWNLFLLNKDWEYEHYCKLWD